ncbi:glycoside hydrolase family 2 TIM barrel-domain containing protein [Pseudomaricurvus sp. HS19]|uniref:glycoside hydrolase family 2 TIM barrel-domain containing protein n=1 Tax=Pseudomaricurvus sp. HS19 TaxID=2692626 RepID=UPI001369C89D|nr:glycoside hydrolase family 2 TIM barrel-domain containing protein [Pseudomaricurvus sp. HS19]MYM62827.1 DUF4982 domain-containing protein [Pseudomaricurvus sp. HS19]
MKKLLFLGALVATALSISSCGSDTSNTDAIGVSGTSSDVAAESPRETRLLTEGWRFQYGDVGEGVLAPDFDDSGWQSVAVPHTWNRVGSYDLEEGPDANSDRGVAWYRLKFVASEADDQNRSYLEFDAVATIAEVWLNGQRLGEHKGAYSRFRFDVSGALQAGDNLLVVKADNSVSAPGSSTEHVLPLGGDYFLFGGIYRNVSLITTSDVQIDLLDHGGPGVYIKTPTVADDLATVDVKTRVRNAARQTRDVSLVVTITDADDAAVATLTTPVSVQPASVVEVNSLLQLDKPRLWNGRQDPYLYRVTVDVVADQQLLDRVEQPLGVRQFAFDADKGFILNGSPLRLLGASRHQDRQGKGWALAPEDHIEDMATMAEMGINSVRQAHYQHAPEWNDAADRTGMIVWAELPYTHETSITHAARPSAELVANAESQLVELIRQNYNHPSIVIWAVGNEVDVGNLVNVRRQRGKGELTQAREFLESLSELALREDDSGRVTAYADCCKATPIAVPGMEDLVGATSVTAFNRYYGWYYGDPATMGEMLDQFHAEYPDQPLGVSEYGAGGAFSQHTDNPLGGPINPQGRPHPEEYQSWYHEENWKVIEARPYLFGTWIWNMFDFAAGSHSVKRAEGETVNINDKGLVHNDHKQRKDAFYFYKANWSDEPVLYITSRRYTDRAYPVVDVRVYSNADEATLFLNEQELGKAPCTDGICVWSSVALQSGANSVRVEATIDGQLLQDSVSWNAPDAEQGLRILVGSLSGIVTADGNRYGSDNFFSGGKAAPVVPFLMYNRQPKPVAGTDSPELYQAYREGNFSYQLPLPNGEWQVTLSIMEPNESKAASRRFNVNANGVAVLENFSPARAAGAAFAATTPSFGVTVDNGLLSLDFIGNDGDAIVSAIAITRQ